MKCAKNKFINICLILLLVLLFTTQATGKLPLHINPANVTASDTNLYYSQLMTLNELMSHWSGIFISLNKGDLDAAQKNFKDYLGLLQDKNNIIEIYGKPITSVTTDKSGHYNYSHTVTYKKPGSYPINVKFIPFSEPLLSSYASSSFDLVPTNTSLTIYAKPAEGIFGNTIHISGSLISKNNYRIPDAGISISLGNLTIGSVRTDANGTYAYGLLVRDLAEGVHILQANFNPDEQPLIKSLS